MKIIKIGRDTNSTILLDHEMISRHHAILRIYGTGKIELISMGANGTKLNGILVRPNVVYKIKRSDMISFAGKYQLDWSLVPDPLRIYRIIIIVILVLLVLVSILILGQKVHSYFNPQIDHQVQMIKADSNAETETNKHKMDETVPESGSEDNLTISLDAITLQQDSIKKQKIEEKREQDRIINNLFPKPQKEEQKPAKDEVYGNNKSIKNNKKDKLEGNRTDSGNNIKKIIIN